MEAPQTVPQAIDLSGLSGHAAALRDALARRLGAASPAIRAYAARDFKPVWLTADGSPSDAALMLVDILRHADDQALPVSRYGADALAAQISRPGADPAELEAALTTAFLAYASDVHSGVLVPSEVDRDIHVEPPRPDAAALLFGAATAGNIAAYLDGLAPQDPSYRRLVERYRTFRSVAADNIWGPRVSPGPSLSRGDRGPRVAAARARLTAMGDLDPNVYARVSQSDGTRVAMAGMTTDVPVTNFNPMLFDAPMEEALKRFQARHGLNQDGVIGPATLAQLNVAPRARAEQIAVNLERMRWLNKDLGERYVFVNLPAFQVKVIDHGRPVLTSKVIVGQRDPKHQSPEFSETMTHMIVNPTWQVPMSIARNEFLPKLKQDPTYLARRGMRLVGMDAEDIDWSTITPATFPGRVTQAPSDANALGNVKFMFPNPYSVYLHDTPSKSLFNHDVRDFSHGCIRVEKAHELAVYLLSGQVSDPAGYFDEVVARGVERQINLDRPLPVYITYRTAWIDRDGVEQFRGDIYGRDRIVARALEAAGVRILN